MDKTQNTARIEKLESEFSDLKIQLEDARFQLQNEREKHQFYQQISDFAFAWELWFEPDGAIKYSSPSCYDLTGFTSNEIIQSEGISAMLVYEPDREKYQHFLSGALNQSLVNPSLEFRVLTRTKQLRWCVINVRGVYDKLGKYLGIRASVQDITRLKRAMGHISDLERGKEFDQRNKQRLQSQLDLKDRELVSFLLQLSQKNELLNKAKNILQKADKKEDTNLSQVVQELREMLDGTANEQVDWSTIENQVEKVHPGFMERLQSRHSNISLKDKRLCSYIRLGLSSREIAGLLNLTPKSVEIARVRLRKKLKLGTSVRLSNYLVLL
ncbi:PAS domain S-box protein [Maribellus sp. CM-23]|uniref:PAS domain S-box protein n=1 Tax=Maribellus sp. CM-23 TaxID=2781026 RepID=UPI001F2947B3|nr:PAS domain S-box protein [Maribellus sp. CM-23]MCE4562982.1 PAS domain S-box protein [Maribellus sp. CM-23]